MKRSFTKGATNDNNQTVPVGIAFQGGGSNGAFAKGAAKALMDSGLIQNDIIDIVAVTGTSAGANNALMVAHGLNTEGPEKVKENLDTLWGAAAQGMRTLKKLARVFNPLAYPIWRMTTWPNMPKSVMDLSFAMMPRGFVVGQLVNTVDKIFNGDWAPVQSGPVKVFINTAREDPLTKERTNCSFTGRGLTKDALAGACSLEALGPHTIDGVDHYDGGYIRNPDFDDILQEPVTDLMVITIMEGPKGEYAPMSQDELRARHKRPGYEVMKSELHPHLAWMRESNPDLNLHVISLNVDERWDDTSRMNTDPAWIATLEAQGYNAMMQWVAEHAHKLGKQSSYTSPCVNAGQPALQHAM